MPHQHPNSKENDLSLTPEEMKAIGEIELGPSRHERFLNNHYRKLIVATLALMILATAAIVYGTFRSTQEEDSASALLGAMNGLPSAEGGERAEGYDIAALEQITAKYPGTQAAASAELLRGMQLIESGEEKSGQDVLRHIIATTPSDFLRLRAQAFLAGHATSGGNLKEAEALWQQVARAGHSPYLGLALLTLGDIAQQNGDTEQARAYYTRLSEECSASALQPTVRQRLLLLGVDAPQPVAPQPTPAPPVDIPKWEGLTSPVDSLQQ